MAPSPRDHTIPRATLVDDVTHRLRDAILNGDMQPDERIQMSELQERFGVSHIPIREALRRLETEGLVVSLPQRGAVVAGVDLADLVGLYDLRRLIEPPTARLAVDRRTPESLERAWLALERLERASLDMSSDDFWRCHREFHWALIEPGANAWIRRTVEQLWVAADRYVRLFVAETASLAMDDHRRFVQLLEAGDADETEALVLRHLKRTEMAVRRGLPGVADGGATPTA